MKTFLLDPKNPIYNAIINGNMDFWQRGTASTQANGASGRIADRHVVAAGTGRSVTVNRSTTLPATATSSQYSYEVVNNSAGPFFVSDFVEPFSHNVEGSILQPLVGKDFTIGFYLFSTIPGVFPIVVRSGALAFSYATTVNVSAGWGYYSTIVPWDPSLAALDNTRALVLDLGAVSGTQYQAPSLNAWNFGNFISHSSATNFYAITGTIFRIAQVQLRSGQWSSSDMQSSFQRTGKDYASELCLCQRYFEIGKFTASPDITNVTIIAVAGPFKTTKRAIPTLLIYSDLDLTVQNSLFHVNGGVNITVTNTNAVSGNIYALPTMIGSGGSLGRFYSGAFLADADF